MMRRNQSNDRAQLPLAVAADAAYKTPAITNFLLENQMFPVLSYTRPKTKDGFFRKHDYVYDEYDDCYLCLQVQVFKYTTTKKDIGNINQIHPFVQNVRFYPSVRKGNTIKNLYSVIFGKLT